MTDFLADFKTEIKSVREATGCCVRCGMRFAGVRDAAAYQMSEEELEAAVRHVDVDAEGETTAEKIEDHPASSSPAPAAVYPICLGILQHCVRPSAVDAVAQMVKDEGYESSDFLLAVALPVQLLLRERGGWLHIQRFQKASTAVAGGGYSAIGSTRDWRGGGGHNPNNRVADSFRRHDPSFEKVVDVKDALRWSMGPALAKALGMKSVGSSPLTIQITLSHATTDGEHHDMLSKILPPEPKNHGNQWNNNKRKRYTTSHKGTPIMEYDSIRTVTRALSLERSDNLLSNSNRFCPPIAPSTPCKVSVTIERSNITLTGRYIKYSRDLPQSPWILEGQRHRQSSVQECITDVVNPLYGVSEAKFCSAGREDVDVRMLGTGRPFTLEMVSPKKPYHDVAALEKAVEMVNACGVIKINELKVCDLSKMSELMKEGEEAHRKDYRCVVHLSRKLTKEDLATLNETSDLVVQQLTPMRVLHRRTLMVRERTIHRLAAVQLSSRFLQLDLTTQAGTYVKEFVHGDFGRTQPNVGSLLGCEADIIQLDVMGLQEFHNGSYS